MVRRTATRRWIRLMFIAEELRAAVPALTPPMIGEKHAYPSVGQHHNRAERNSH